VDFNAYLLGLAVGGLFGLVVAIIMCVRPPECDCACCVGCEECDCYCDECDCDDCACPDCNDTPETGNVTINVGPVDSKE
jgi:hypothetical protein